jgi:hypothetical protein
MKEFMYELVKIHDAKGEKVGGFLWTNEEVIGVIDVYGWSDENIISKYFSNYENVYLNYIAPWVCEVMIDEKLEYGIFGFEPTE